MEFVACQAAASCLVGYGVTQTVYATLAPGPIESFVLLKNQTKEDVTFKTYEQNDQSSIPFQTTLAPDEVGRLDARGEESINVYVDSNQQSFVADLESHYVYNGESLLIVD